MSTTDDGAPEVAFDPTRPAWTKDGREARVRMSPCTRFLAGSVDGTRTDWRLDGTHEVSGALDLTNVDPAPVEPAGDLVLDGGAVIAICGAIGSGKALLAAAIAEETSRAVVSFGDQVRREV